MMLRSMVTVAANTETRKPTSRPITITIGTDEYGEGEEIEDEETMADSAKERKIHPGGIDVSNGVSSHDGGQLLAKYARSGDDSMTSSRWVQLHIE